MPNPAAVARLLRRVAALLVAAASALDRPQRGAVRRRTDIDLGDLYADTHGRDLAGVLTAPRWTQYDPAAFADQLAGARACPQPTPVARSLPRGHTPPPNRR